MSKNVAVLVGSLRRDSFSKKLAAALASVAPADLRLELVPIGALPFYSEDLETEYPPQPWVEFRDRIRKSDAVLFVTPEYNRSIPGPLKNAIDWASRPWGQNSFHHIPAAVIGASPGAIGTAVGQQSLRAVLSFCNARQMTAPEAYITFSPEVFPGGGKVANESTKDFLKNYLAEFRDHVERVLTVLPRQA